MMMMTKHLLGETATPYTDSRAEAMVPAAVVPDIVLVAVCIKAGLVVRVHAFMLASAVFLSAFLRVWLLMLLLMWLLLLA